MPGNALARAHADRALHVVGKPQSMRDHEVVGGVLPQHERRALTANQLRGHTEDRVEQILSSTPVQVFHLSPHSCVAARTGFRRSVLACFPAVTSGSLRSN